MYLSSLRELGSESKGIYIEKNLENNFIPPSSIFHKENKNPEEQSGLSRITLLIAKMSLELQLISFPLHRRFSNPVLHNLCISRCFGLKAAPGMKKDF